ncbi:BTAD domain-containing putative transcriptional regulator [uncultured Streptomyces sp.]|uniref:tetratricopeptide repeat protein n=1 Tax=uncultured Streptomyces sp. TaxID=174707 RepID=UPI002614706D|nr:tetratricopeptide repeat protein [uncultured Streptomyces sp.]
MNVMPQQDPEPRQPSSASRRRTDAAPPQDAGLRSDPDTSADPPLAGATAVPPPPPTLRTSLRRAAVGAVAAGVLVAGAVVAVPDDENRAVPARPGPVERAEAAATAGAPAALSDLTALIGDRQQWVEKHPADAPSWAALGSAYVEWGRRAADLSYYGRAEQALKRSLSVRPGERGNGAAWVGLASLANARHDYLAAKKWGETVRARAPKSWLPYPALIDAYRGLGDQAAANKATETFAALRKGAPALARTAEMYRDQGWREDALATAQETADRAATPAERAAALHRLGDLAWERGEPEEALAQYDAALRTDRAHHASLAGRARALVALDRADEALAAYQTAVGQLPRPEYVLELAELYESLGLDGDATTQYETFHALIEEAEANGVDESLLRARYESDHGDPEVAVELLRSEWAELRRGAEVADALGWALYRAGEPQEALTYAAKAVDSGLRSASFAYHLGAIERETGHYGPARRHLEQALRTNPDFSPLDAPAAREALDALGEPPSGGPKDMQPPPAPEPVAPATPAPEAPAAPAKPKPVPPPATTSPAAPGTAAKKPAEGTAPAR